MFCGQTVTMDTALLAATHVLWFLQLTAANQPSKSTVTAADSPGPVVRTRAGPVRGHRATDGNYTMFLGVPYARVHPDNPFGPAIPHFFEDVFDAYDDSAICPQIEQFNYTITGTLDCLHLNIYVPNNASVENPLPVMVYIYGGVFKTGFSGRYLYGPRFLVRHDIVFVTFNYRLGPYGFMCLDSLKVPGNQGLKDQLLALRWIKQNIQVFGGDTSRITLAGNSAGAMSADIHGHFLQEHIYDRIILQSGSAQAYDLIMEPDPEAPFKLAKEFNYITNDIDDALSYLSGVQPHELIAATNKSGLVFGPCVENQLNNDSYVTKHPNNIKKVKRADVLIGFTNDEAFWTIFKQDKETFESRDHVSFYFDNVFEMRNDMLYAETKDIIKHFYYGDDADSAQYKRLTINMGSDFTVNHPTLRTVNKYLHNGVENMYLYMFSYTGHRGFIKHLRNKTYIQSGATHADELGYLFDVSYMEKPLNAKDMIIVDRMTELWTNFIKYGNPTPRPTELIPLHWPRVTREKMPYLEIDTDMHVRWRPMHERMAFQDLLFKTIGQYQKWLD